MCVRGEIYQCYIQYCHVLVSTHILCAHTHTYTVTYSTRTHSQTHTPLPHTCTATHAQTQKHTPHISTLAHPVELEVKYYDNYVSIEQTTGHVQIKNIAFNAYSS